MKNVPRILGILGVPRIPRIPRIPSILGVTVLLGGGLVGCTAGQRRGACPELFTVGASGAQNFAGNQGTSVGGFVSVTYRLKAAPTRPPAPDPSFVPALTPPLTQPPSPLPPAP